MNISLIHNATIIRTANHCKVIPIVVQEVDLVKSVYTCDEGTIKIVTDKVNVAYEIFDKGEEFDIIIETNSPHSLNFPRFIKLLNARIQTIKFDDYQGTGIVEIRAICYKWTYVYNYKSKEKVKVMLI
jgi:hypothetical protein